MIPLRDSEAARRLTPSTVLLILLNVAVFACELRFAKGDGINFAHYAMIPASVARAHLFNRELRVLATLITSQFLHAGVLHIAGNMLYLLIFGPAIEHRMGHLRFVIFYLLAGIVAALTTVVMAPASWIPVIGASGAIAGVLGAYFVLFPRGRITTVWFVRIIEIPAIFYLLIWFALQLYSGIASGPGASPTGGVAWWSHVGGFLFGVAVAPFLASKIIKSAPRVRAQISPS